jgi:hypothetical protein
MAVFIFRCFKIAAYRWDALSVYGNTSCPFRATWGILSAMQTYFSSASRVTTLVYGQSLRITPQSGRSVSLIILVFICVRAYGNANRISLCLIRF